MRRAHKRGAATKGGFFFRSNIGYALTSPDGRLPGGLHGPCADKAQSGPEEMTLLQILEGKVREWAEVVLLDMPTVRPCFWSFMNILSQPRARAPTPFSRDHPKATNSGCARVAGARVPREKVVTFRLSFRAKLVSWRRGTRNIAEMRDTHADSNYKKRHTVLSPSRVKLFVKTGRSVSLMLLLSTWWFGTAWALL